MAWVVTATGPGGGSASHRIVEANDEAEALEQYLVAVPRAGMLAGGRGALTARLATESDHAAFTRRRARPAETLTLPMELPEPTRKVRRSRGQSA